ncbi:hypothetical protein KHA96_03825 [Bacillus sp. FJAT-49711]|uniref:hypothetical protein n=1 Tax=Bacillus sp. FJAT-49711 TaxID=2833585 RepID=UPI001BCA587F|nr:hypothetical protein [Bacillus sp. FJAT-49711]MBS4217439.1 hypothetical protein [Bacillus sp. FJAT-49711]
MKKNSVFPTRKSTENKSNKMWVPLLTTVGISAAMYGLRKYKNGKWMNPIQNFMNKFQNTGVQSVLSGATSNPLTEFSQELSNLNTSGSSQQNTAANQSQQNTTGSSAQQSTVENNAKQNTQGSTSQQNTAKNMNSRQKIDEYMNQLNN